MNLSFCGRRQQSSIVLTEKASSSTTAPRQKRRRSRSRVFSRRSSGRSTRGVFAIVYVLIGLALIACEDATEESIAKAKEHVDFLVGLTKSDVEEVRSGLPEGAVLFGTLFEKSNEPGEDREAVRDALLANRRKVQDLRVAKSTFFALTDADGVILRNDQEQDQMAGQRLFEAYPELKQALSGKYVETTGHMEAADAVAEPRPDAQWVAAHPVEVGGDVKGLYVTGWSWSRYAYRLEFALRGKIRSKLLEDDAKTEKEPLIYVFIAEGGAVYAAPVTPEVNIEAVRKAQPVEKSAEGLFAQAVEITGREFGLAAKRAPALGDNVAVVVLRSET